MLKKSIKILGILSVFLCFQSIVSQAKPNKKPQVLVYGNSIAAYTAAIQSAKSGLNTIWITGSVQNELIPELFQTSLNYDTTSWESGIWRDLLLNTYKDKGNLDSILNKTIVKINPTQIRAAIEDQLIKLPNLQVIKKDGVKKLSYSKKTWTFVLNDKSKWKVRSVIDASLQADLSKYAKIELENRLNLEIAELENPQNEAWAKTSISSATLPSTPVLMIPLGQITPKDSNNFYPIYSWPWIKKLQIAGNEGISAMAQIGQGVGAIAAFAAFFKVNNNKLDSRQIQAELLQYNAVLIPFLDVDFSNPNWRAIQKVSLSGLLGRPKTNQKDGVYFHPNSGIYIEDIAPALKQLYSRSQIWLIDHPSGILTMRDLLELIKQIGQKGQELEEQIRKSWTRKYKWEHDLQLDLPATREQLAVLFDEFCKPFEVKIGFQGQVIR